MENTLNLFKISGFPMLQSYKADYKKGEGECAFIHNQTVSVGDLINYKSVWKISKIIEQREPKGDVGDAQAKYYKVELKPLV